MTYAPQSKENSSLQHQQQSTNATAQTFSDEREATAATSALQAMMANNPQQQNLKTTAQMMANRPAQQNVNATAQSFANKPEPIQRVEDEEPLQPKFETEPAQREAAEAPRPNNTGLPDNLKSGIENLSGMSMDHVKVHYNSDKPAQLQAHAYAQGGEIHVAPGQEQYLPHEAWHVVQQAQGRVRPTMQMKGCVPLSDDMGLETEADVMGATAIQKNIIKENRQLQQDVALENPSAVVMQRKIGRMDGSNDMSADEIETWLTNAGIFDTLDDGVLDMIEAMMQSSHQWMYSGMGALGIIQDAKELMTDFHYSQGLIHGDLRRAQNEADFHVDPGDGGNLTQDMLIVAQDSYDKMTVASTLPGRPNGKIYLRPQGAAIIKIVAQLLGEALGNSELINVAHKEIYYRKLKEKAISLIPFYKKKPMSKENLDKSVIPEHIAYIRALVGAVGIDIQPILPGTTTMQEFTQNMLEASEEGENRLNRYIQTLQTGDTPVSMNIYIDRSRLPDVINKLK